MTANTIVTRSGDHSAKTAHRIGAPNHHDNAGSGETPMLERPGQALGICDMPEHLHQLADFLLMNELPDAYVSLSNGSATVIVESKRELDAWAQAIGTTWANVYPTSAGAHVTVDGRVGAVWVKACLAVDATDLGSYAPSKRTAFPLAELAFVGADAR
jgi:hypothetical protein